MSKTSLGGNSKNTRDTRVPCATGRANIMWCHCDAHRAEVSPILADIQEFNRSLVYFRKSYALMLAVMQTKWLVLVQNKRLVVGSSVDGQLNQTPNFLVGCLHIVIRLLIINKEVRALGLKKERDFSQLDTISTHTSFFKISQNYQKLNERFGAYKDFGYR